MPTISLTRGYETEVDDADFAVLSAYKWHALVTKRHVYACRCEHVAGKRRRIYMHRVILGAGPGELVDHVNRNTLDNRRQNLRKCDHVQNAMNSVLSRESRSKFRGVRRNGGSRVRPWQAGIVVSGKYHHIGCFATEEEAGAAYDTIARLLYPGFARGITGELDGRSSREC